MKIVLVPTAALSLVVGLAVGGPALAQYEEGANPVTRPRPPVVQKVPKAATKTVNASTQSALTPSIRCKDGTTSKQVGASACAGHGGAAVVPLDRSTASAPHKYPPSARVNPPPRPLRSNDRSQAGTVHKDAPLDQIAGAGG
jgi:hypothetical protein